MAISNEALLFKGLNYDYGLFKVSRRDKRYIIDVILLKSDKRKVTSGGDDFSLVVYVSCIDDDVWSIT